MKCPKCGHEQTNKVECEGCGVFFEKYAKSLQEKSEPKQTTEEKPPVPTITMKSNNRPWLIAGGALGVVAVLSLFFIMKAYKSPDKSQYLFSETVVIENELGDESTRFQEANDTNGNGGSSRGIRDELQETNPPRNRVEKATLATVFISAPWGTGSGFFVN